MSYLYENHMGGWYTTEDELTYDELHCETCNDSDYPIGEYTTNAERILLLVNSDLIGCDLDCVDCSCIDETPIGDFCRAYETMIEEIRRVCSEHPSD